MTLAQPKAFAERRQFGRRKTSLHAWISIEGRPKIACVVRNVSEGGALLEFPVPKAMPYRFQLIVDCEGFEAWCEIRHSGDTWAGVQFVRVDKTARPISHWQVEAEDAWAGQR